METVEDKIKHYKNLKEKAITFLDNFKNNGGSNDIKTEARVKESIYQYTCFIDTLTELSSIKVVGEETPKLEIKEQNTLLDDIDYLLAHFEDFTHGKDGDDITIMRKRIAEFLRLSGVDK